MIDSSNSSKQPAFNILLLVIVLAFFSGSAALSHELLWTRRLIDLLGATDWVVGRVLGLFFFGLSVGGYLATFLTRSSTPAISRLSTVETLIALLALPATFLPIWTDWIWQSIGTEAIVSWQGSAIKLLITIIVVLPPAIAMGFTFPLFIRTTTDLGANVASAGIWVYAINTLGGVFGLWFASTYLISWFGAQWTMIATSCVNALIAILLWLLYRIHSKKSKPFESIDEGRRKSKLASKVEKLQSLESNAGATHPAPPKNRLLLLSFVSGFVVLSLEVLLLRIIALVVPSSYHTTSALLANVILILAFGSLLISFSNILRGVRKIAGSNMLIVAAFFAAAVYISLCPIFLYESSDKLISIRYLQGLNGNNN